MSGGVNVPARMAGEIAAFVPDANWQTDAVAAVAVRAALSVLDSDDVIEGLAQTLARLDTGIPWELLDQDRYRAEARAVVAYLQGKVP